MGCCWSMMSIFRRHSYETIPTKNVDIGRSPMSKSKDNKSPQLSKVSGIISNYCVY
jgi:hypothetical protein